MGWQLNELCKAVKDCRLLNNKGDISISGITLDSRAVKSGNIFTAVKGEKVDGQTFIASAHAKGAVAILTDPTSVDTSQKDITWIVHEEPRLAYAKLAALLMPLQPEVMVAVTGTNGKTSVANFYAQCMSLLGYRSASIGTLGYYDGDGVPLFEESGMTTPMAQQLHQSLDQMHQKGITHAAMEASSHGLSQYRMHGVKLKAAGFTSFSRDHMDYHKSEQDYFNAKMKLFSEVLPSEAVAVLNADDPRFEEAKHVCEARKLKLWSYGKKGETIKILAIEQQGVSQRVTISFNKTNYLFDLALIGSFQVYNVICALALVLASEPDISLERLLPCLAKLRGVPGRMQQVIIDKQPHKPHVVIDYAHTPDGLEKALKEMAKIAKGKLWVVFGCGGNRDKGKRSQMGRVAYEHADHIIVTDDNPRDEDPEAIRSDIISECPNAIVIGDRHRAIGYAVDNACDQDMILIAGKGHETYQLIKDKKLEFDDYKVAKEWLEV